MTVRQRWCMLGIMALAFLVRVWALDFKPAHFDEGVNGAFVDSMRVSGAYHYQPDNYHGPLHFYVLFAGQQLFGRSLWVLRMPTVLIGTGVVLLMLAFRRFLPFRAVALAALFVAVSPAMIFYSRYAIHEMWLPFFALLACYGGFGLGTRERSSCDLWCVGLGLTGMILTKETYLLHFIAAFLAIGALWLFDRMQPKWQPEEIELEPRPADLSATVSNAEPERASEELPKIPGKEVVRVWAVCFGLLVAFYSGFGFHWDGIGGMLTTFAHMHAKGTSSEEGHNKEMLYWVKLLAYYEWPALLGLIVAPFLGLRRSLLAGFVLVLTGVTMVATDIISLSGVPWERRDADFLAPDIGLTSFGALGLLSAITGIAFFVSIPAANQGLQWLALYGLASFAAYTFIPYKTSWCSVNFLWPFCFVAGYVLHQWLQTRWHAAAFAMIALICAGSVYCGGRLNFIDPTHDALPPTRDDMPEGDRYAYVQTTFDIQKLLHPVRTLIGQSRTHRSMRGLILGEAFPLIWELNDLPNVSFHESTELLTSYDADFLIVPDLRREEIESQLVGIYFREPYQSRGGTNQSWLYLQAARFQAMMPAGRMPEVKPRIPLTL